MKITVLVNDQLCGAFCTEFGLSLLLQGRESWLFDTGAGGALAPNLRRLGIAPETLDKVILSHGHCDHTGGLHSLSPQEVWCCPGIMDGHFSRHADGTVHCLTMPEAAQKTLRAAKIHSADSFRAVSDEFYLTGPIPRISGEDCGGDFFRDAACRKKDTIPDEQALLTPDGVLIAGCCHAGIINTLEFCRKKHPEIPVRAIAGGLHLRRASRERMEKTAAYISRTGVRQLFLLHCTGEAALEYLRTALPECRIAVPAIGQTFEP